MIQRDDVGPESPGFGADDPHHRLAELRRRHLARHLDRHLRSAPAGHARLRRDAQAVQLGLAGDHVRELRL
jgi:hypothetical protein